MDWRGIGGGGMNRATEDRRVGSCPSGSTGRVVPHMVALEV